MYTPGQYPDPILDAIFTDFQNQITANLTGSSAAVNGVQAQIKQVTLTLEGELKTVLAALATLQTFVQSNIT